jgi:rod shape-determining protein MreD
MRGVIRVFLVLIAVWLQASFFGAFHVLGVIPNVLIVLVIYAGLICNASETALMALLGGLLLDLASGPDFGMRIGFYVLLALLIAVLKQAGTDFENTGMVLAATLAATILFDLAILSSLLITTTPVAWPAVGRVVLAEVLVNSMLAIILRWPLGWLLGKSDFSFSSRRRARSI